MAFQWTSFGVHGHLPFFLSGMLVSMRHLPCGHACMGACGCRGPDENIPFNPVLLLRGHRSPLKIPGQKAIHLVNLNLVTHLPSCSLYLALYLIGDARASCMVGHQRPLFERSLTFSIAVFP